jgi:hypothetical protein
MVADVWASSAMPVKEPIGVMQPGQRRDDATGDHCAMPLA